MLQKLNSLTKICPICKGIAKRHRRRNSKSQYQCEECKGFFTEDPKHKRRYSGNHYDKFILKYIQLKIGGGKINITQLCAEFDLKRPTLYRMLPGFDLLAFIYKWFRVQGIISHKRVAGGTLQLFLVGYAIKTLSIKVVQTTAIQNECNVIFESKLPFAEIWRDSLFVSIPEESMFCSCSVKIAFPFEENLITMLLSSFRSLKNQSA